MTTINTLAKNNAQWCDWVLSGLGSPGRWVTDIWYHPDDVPPIYPHADTLTDNTEQQLKHIKQLVNYRDGKSIAVKDSWSKLNLTGLDFEIMFEAEWLLYASSRVSVPEHDLKIERISTAKDLQEFTRCCNEAYNTPDVPLDVFSPALLDNPDIVFLAGKVNDKIAAGITCVQSHGVNGLNNLFAFHKEDELLMIREGMTVFPKTPACTYSGYDSVADYVHLGFQPMGKLRVWSRPADA